MKDERLKTYVICSHVDKILSEEQISSVYDVPIQAGAARTDKRICALNDHDGFSESISERNHRYSEGTAMWWIAKHLDTPYVGLAHYRRRLKISDEELAECMDAGIDIVTSQEIELDASIAENYGKALFPADWRLFMEILHEYAPEDEGFAKEVYSSSWIHPCNVGVYRAEWYREFSEWAFPMTEAFCRRSPEKTDRYQVRDAGFILERLTHLYVMKKRRQGLGIIEVPITNLKSVNWTPASEEIDLTDPEQVYERSNHLYKEGWIGRACMLILEARKKDVLDERLKLLDAILGLGQMERAYLPSTMHEYLPAELRSDLDVLSHTYESYRKVVRLYLEKKNEEAATLLRGYVQLTHFSQVVTAGICTFESTPQEDVDNLIRAAYGV